VKGLGITNVSSDRLWY